MKQFKQYGRFLTYALILAIPFYIFRYKIGAIPTTFLEELILVAFFVNLIAGNIKIKNKAVFFSALALVVFAFISALMDPQVSRGLGLFKAYFLDGFLLYLMFSSQSDELYLPLLSISGALTSVLALVASSWTADGRLFDLDKLSPNYLSMFLAPIFVLALYQAIIKRYRILNIACLAAMLVAIVLAGSRGGYVGIIAGIIFMLGSLAYEKLSKPKVIFASVLLFIILLGGTFVLFKPQANDMGRTGSSSNIRYYIWTTSLEMIQNHPLLGVGIGNYQDSFKELTDGRVNYNEYIAPEALTAHNLYLHLYLTTGIFGLVSFVAILYFALRKSKNKVVLAALVVILVYGLVDTPVFRNDLAAMFFIIIALL